MRKIFMGFLAAVSFPHPVAAQDASEPLTPSDIVAAAPASDWVRIAPSDLVVMELAPDAAKHPRRVVIQLMPAPFSQGWVDNIRKLVAARWYDGIAVVRTQDNYVVQWGDPDGENPKKAKPLPASLKKIPESQYTIDIRTFFEPMIATAVAKSGKGETISIGWQNSIGIDSYQTVAHLSSGWPIAERDDRLWPIHCYGMVGVGRNVSPDTGTGAELYAVIGQAPRQLDRNIALAGRVIAGMEILSALPRGTGDLGFYKTPEERTPILSVRMGNEVPGLPAYEYLSTESVSFAAYAGKRANRKDAFYIQPAGGVDVCNVPVPVRAVQP